MLRFDHLPSDFNPMFLFLGEKQDRDGFCWRLNSWQAEKIAERIELLTPAHQKSGSDIIELGVEGEIPVKISLGEFTDDFLVQRF